MYRQSLYSILRMALVTHTQVEKVAGTYSLEEVMDYNNLEEVDVMYILFTEGHCEVPKPEPVDYETP